MSTWEFVQNSSYLVIFITIVYAIARVVNKLADGWSVRVLEPLAAAINGLSDASHRYSQYQGRDVRISYTPEQSAGAGEGATTINAFHIDVLDLLGKENWMVRFYVTGLLGQGAKRACIETRDNALANRLNSEGVTELVEAVSAPTATYATVEYDKYRKTLTYTDDVAPEKIPSKESFTKQLALAARLAAINERVNPS